MNKYAELMREAARQSVILSDINFDRGLKDQALAALAAYRKGGEA